MELLPFISRARPSEHADVAKAGQQLVADVLAAAIAGTAAPTSRLVAGFVTSQFAAGPSTVLGPPQPLVPMAAALANANTANALDIDESIHPTKGHPGACVVPGVLAVAEAVGASGRDFLDAAIVGYEVAVRAGLTAHAVRPEYHSTGAWAAVGVCAGALRLHRADDETVRAGLGIAEHQAPYAPMMRCIAQPSMVKDGIGWGAMNGVAAAELALAGHTGINSMLQPLEDGEVAAGQTATLGDLWWVKRADYKSHAGCHWGHPTLEGFRHIIEDTGASLADIEAITLHVFANAAELSTDVPTTTEEAQYNLAYPLACWAVFGEVGPEQILGGYGNEAVKSIMARIRVEVDSEAEAAFPQRQLGRTSVLLRDGRRLQSPMTEGLGNHTRPLTDEGLREKFRWLVEPLLQGRTAELADVLDGLDDSADLKALTALLRCVR